MSKKIFDKILNTILLVLILFPILFSILCGCYYFKMVDDINFLKDIHIDLYNLHSGYLLTGMSICLLTWGMIAKISVEFNKLRNEIRKLEEKIGGKNE